VHVVETPQWNAFAVANGSVWVFSGLLDDLRDDDELAIVLGHEVAHYTHEHMRRKMKQGMWRQLAVVGVNTAMANMTSPAAVAATRQAAILGLQAWASGYGRSLEDQADRVGLRYAYEGGFDVSKGPQLWARQSAKHGQLDRVSSFFLDDHSRSSERMRHLDQEISRNYNAR
jgi:Zn-dependent protease with chaperone function